MRAGADSGIMEVWRRFDRHPMETLTKAWYFGQVTGNRQRSVELMREHWERYGASGNCFDLALWLMEEYRLAGVRAWAIGHDLCSKDAHVAVIAEDEQGSFFCDLGDQWVEPILVNPSKSDFCMEALGGFLTAGRVQVEVTERELHFQYIRPNGKTSAQSFDRTPIPADRLLPAAEHSQSLLRHPLVEMRVRDNGGAVKHWEFVRWSSFVSSNDGLFPEEAANDVEDWAERIRVRTGIVTEITRKALEVYSQLRQ